MEFFDCFTVSSFTREPAYRTFPLKDRNRMSGTTKRRIIHDPNDEMRIVHRRLKEYLLELRRRTRVSYKHVTAFEERCSPWKNVMRHYWNRRFFLTDLRDAYGHVGSRQMAALLCELDPALGELPLLREGVHMALRRYCFDADDKLVTGAVASPALFNLYLAVRLDAKLAPLAAKYGLTYTRYCDDLTFSHRDRAIGATQRRNLRNCIIESGFELAHHKTQVLDLDHGPIIINGIGINGRNKRGPCWETFAPGRHRRRIKGMMNSVAYRTGRLEVLRGLMALFFHIHGRKQLTRAERKLVDRFWQVVPKRQPKKKRQQQAA